MLFDLFDVWFYIYTRFHVRTDLCATSCKQNPLSYLGRIGTDSLVHDADALVYLIKKLELIRSCWVVIILFHVSFFQNIIPCIYIYFGCFINIDRIYIYCQKLSISLLLHFYLLLISFAQSERFQKAWKIH